MTLKQGGALQRFDESFVLKDQDNGEPLPHYPYRIEDAQGALLHRGVTDAQGRTARVYTGAATGIRLLPDAQ